MITVSLPEGVTARRGVLSGSPEALKLLQGRIIATVRKQGGGRPRRTDVPRCTCGEMTLKRAEARGHKCETTGPNEG